MKITAVWKVTRGTNKGKTRLTLEDGSFVFVDNIGDLKIGSDYTEFKVQDELQDTLTVKPIDSMPKEESVSNNPFNADEITLDNFIGIQKVMKKPIPIHAIQLNFEEGFTVTTMEGKVEGKSGDYLMFGIDGEKYPCAKSIFERSYDIITEEYMKSNPNISAEIDILKQQLNKMISNANQNNAFVILLQMKQLLGE